MSTRLPTTRAVVDTDVVSFLFKRDSRAELYRRHLTGALLTISFMTLAELERWTLEHNWGSARRAALDRYLERFVVHPSSPAICRIWAEVVVGVRRRGRVIQAADGWIAATALLLGAPLITNNRSDYAGVDGLTVISEVGT